MTDQLFDDHILFNSFKSTVVLFLTFVLVSAQTLGDVMKFSTVSIILSAILVSTSVFAQTQDQIKEQISSLAREIRNEAITSNASNDSLLQARTLLEDALDLLKSQGSGGGSKDCIDFAYAKYYASHSSSVAADKASAACKIIEDVDVAKFAYEKYYSASSPDVAMDKATLVSTSAQKNKLDMIKFAYEKYYSASSASVAMDSAGKGVAKVRRGQLSCLQSLYTKYYSSNSASVAMDKALAGCAE